MKNKNVLVTGASRGIGRAIAIAFAEAGWSVGICCRHSAAELESLKKIIEAMGRRCFACLGDIGNYEDARAFVTGAADFLGPIDCLVNNAGISHIGLLSDMSPEEWNHIIQTNLTSVFNCCHGIIPGMVARQTGSIINISSVWGICGRLLRSCLLRFQRRDKCAHKSPRQRTGAQPYQRQCHCLRRH